MDPKRVYDFDPRNLPQELLAAIGLAIASGSQTEAVMAMTIGGCLGIDSELNMAVTTHMTLPLKFSVLRSTAEIKINDLDALDRLDTLLEAVDQALNKRHTLAHSSFCRDEETGKTFRVKASARTRVEGDLVPVSTRAIKAEAAFIYKAGMDLMMFAMEHGLMPHHPPPRPRGHKTKAARKKRRESLLRK
jgi:hypothetical protein